jgi:hypothetical protein
MIGWVADGVTQWENNCRAGDGARTPRMGVADGVRKQLQGGWVVMREHCGWAGG